MWLDAIDAHVVRADWGAALEVAVRAWRERPCAALAELIDALAAKLPAEEMGGGEWSERAARLALRVERDGADATSAVEVGALLGATFVADPVGWSRDPSLAAFHAARRQEPRGCEALAYKIRFPPDPRVADVIVRWCETVTLGWPRGYYGALGDTQPLRDQLDRIAAALAATVDARLRERLEALALRPDGRSNATRTAQRVVGEAGLAVIAAAPPAFMSPTERARIAAALGACGGSIARAVAAPPKPRTYEPDALWREVAAAPDDDAPRLVLADALTQAGDPRGELIVAQIAGRARRASKVIAREWMTWLGSELGRVAMRRSSRFVRGMLDVVSIGPGSVPSWVYAATHGHRELMVVTTVRLSRVHPPDYAAFVDALPNVRDVQIDTPAIAAALVEGAPRALAQLERIAIAPQVQPDLRALVAPLVEVMPRLREIEVGWLRVVDVAAVANAYPQVRFVVRRERANADTIPPALLALPNVREA